MASSWQFYQVVFGTSNDRYDARDGSKVLESIGEQSFSVATNNLLSKGVLTKVIRDHHKKAPGRRYKISEKWAYYLYNIFATDMSMLKYN